MFNAFITLFSEADVLFYILFAFSVALLVAEVFIPSFGIVGLGGLLMSVGAILYRCISKGVEGVLVFYYILHFVICLFVLVGLVKIIFKLSTRKNKKKKFAMVDGNKIPLTSDGYLDYSFLVGKEGEVYSDLKPTGKIKIEGKIYDATTTKEYIYSGTRIRVDKIVAQRIVVKKKG